MKISMKNWTKWVLVGWLVYGWYGDVKTEKYSQPRRTSKGLDRLKKK